jgi:hypothetical protein
VGIVRGDFDAVGLFEALEAKRHERALSWRQVADEIWQQSAVLNNRRQDHPISPSTIMGVAKRKDTSCQHALFMLRWLAATPESFVSGAAGGPRDVRLPAAGPDRRLRWNLKALHGALDAQRRVRRLTWARIASECRCTPSQLTGLRTARFATGMGTAMRVTAWLDRPAADFIHAAQW